MSVKNFFIQVKNLSFAYGEHKVLDRVTFRLEKGDYVGIVGPNGGGKTTLLKLLAGLVEPQTGEISIGSSQVAEAVKQGRVGYVPQRIAQDTVSFPATVYEIIESARIAQKRLFSSLSSADKKAIQEAMTIANITDLQDRLMSTLSGGQRQRVYVARALASNPEVLLLDEPFVGVDIAAQEEFYSFLKKLNKQGLTIIFVSHDVDIISEEVKSILCLNKGLLCLGDSSLLHQPKMIEKLYGKKFAHIHHVH